MQLYVHVQYVARQHVYLDIPIRSHLIHILLFFPKQFYTVTVLVNKRRASFRSINTCICTCERPFGVKVKGHKMLCMPEINKIQ